MTTNRLDKIMAVVACLMIVPLQAWAEPSFSIPRASSTTERQLQEESLYLKEETVSIASRYEQPISRAPSDVYVITDEDIRSSGSTDIPTLLRRVPGMEVMQTNAGDFLITRSMPAFGSSGAPSPVRSSTIGWVPHSIRWPMPSPT